MTIDINQANEGLRANARGAINALITVNSGAAVALLTQLSQLSTIIELDNVMGAFKYWLLGIASGLFAWFFITVASSAHAWGQRKREMCATYLAYLSWIVGIVLFLVGGFSLLYAVV